MTISGERKLIERLCPEPARSLPGERGMRIGLRTAHLAAMGVLLGGHVFDVEPHRLLPRLCLAIGTGAAFVAIELHGSCVWIVQGRGIVTLLKLTLLALVPIFWSYRVAFLLAVVIMGSVGSHMPGRYRYYSILHGRAVAFRHACWEPLLALYGKTVLQLVQSLLDTGKLAMQLLLDAADAAALPLPTDWPGLAHVNTPDRLRAKLPESPM